MPDYEAVQLLDNRSKENPPAKTDKPFEWFPELKKMFENFDIKHMAFTVQGKDDNTDILYAIKQKAGS